MPRGLGTVQQKILQALREDPKHSSELKGLAYYIEGKTVSLRDDYPLEPPSPAVYSAVARAVQSLEKRGLVKAEISGDFTEMPGYVDFERWVGSGPPPRYIDVRGRECRKPTRPCRYKTVTLAEPATEKREEAARGTL